MAYMEFLDEDKEMRKARYRKNRFSLKKKKKLVHKHYRKAYKNKLTGGMGKIG